MALQNVEPKGITATKKDYFFTVQISSSQLILKIVPIVLQFAGAPGGAT